MIFFSEENINLQRCWVKKCFPPLLTLWEQTEVKTYNEIDRSKRFLESKETFLVISILKAVL